MKDVAENEETAERLAVSSRATAAWLLIVVVALNALSFFLRAGDRFLGLEGSEIVRLFDVSEEANITSWFSSLLLLAVAILFAVVAKGTSAAGRPYARHWAFLAGLFVLLSLEEVVGFHELAIEPLRSGLGASGALYYTWVVVAIPLVLVLAAMFARFAFHLPPRTRNLFILSIGVYLAGAIGFEMIGGFFADDPGGGVSAVGIAVTLEEFLENLGVVLLIWATTSYMAAEPDLSELSVRFT